MEAQLEPSLTRWFTPEALAADAPGVKYARDCVLTMDPADWAAAWRSMKELDVQGKLAGFGRPVLVVAGDKDLSCPPEFLREVAERIPNSTFRVLPGVPHLQTLERPGLITETLDEFLPKA
jgi:3-oxoadipate enol-lactonase